MQATQLNPKHTLATSKRDYFAAIALQGLCAAGGGEAKILARRAVLLADALIEELENQ